MRIWFESHRGHHRDERPWPGNTGRGRSVIPGLGPDRMAGCPGAYGNALPVLILFHSELMHERIIHELVGRGVQEIRGIDQIGNGPGAFPRELH